MQCRLVNVALIVAVAVVLGVHKHAVAGEQVPFKGNLEGNVTVTPVAPPNVVDVFIDGAGNSTQLGAFTVSIPHQVDRGQVPPSAIGAYEFIAANGDELHADFTGQSMLIAPGILYIVETATIIGGTGRFAGASGSFVCERWYDILAGTTVGEFDGTISSVGKN